MLKENTFFGEEDKVQIAIERLRSTEPPEGYYLAFSGGKDSIVIKALADMAGVKYDAHYNITNIDPPELIYFIREHHAGVIFDRPEKPFLQMLVEKGFPQRQRRWCCAYYKERGGSGRVVVTGVRWAESANRKNRRMVEHCYKDTTKRYLNPIIDWSDEDVWEFIKKSTLPYCKLYDEGFKRIGCLFCPFAAGPQRIYETKRYPKFKQAFIRAFQAMHESRKKKGLKGCDRWKNGEEMFNWWINENRKSFHPDQMVIFE